MMNETQTKEAVTRLKKVEGQVRGIINMIEDGRYCIDILSQTRAVVSAIRKVEDIILDQHLRTCVVDSVQSDSLEDKTGKIDEIMSLFSKYGKS